MNLNNIARYDKGIGYNETLITPEGFIKGRAIVTRCGVFLYKNADGTVRKELRHPDDVREKESLESIKMIPIVDGHPPERLINAENAKRLSVGFTGELIEDEYPFIISNLVITDKAIVEKIKNKKKNELSLGYTVDLVPESGIYEGQPYDFIQTNIRYNHLALVDEARAGPEARIALDGNDAILIEESEMTNKKMRKVKIDAEEYMLEDDAAMSVEGMKKKYEDLKGAHENLIRDHKMMKDSHDKMMAERDSMRDKDHHDPKTVHEPLSGEKSEEDEIGSKGKEEKDPIDLYGMQSHVRDYDKPSHMKEHVVSEPKNEHYPHDLPKIPNVDSNEFNRRVKDRVKLEKLSQRYLDRDTLSRMDSMSDLDIKKVLIKTIQKNANLDGKSEVYINARFDSVLEEMPREKVIAIPSRYDGHQSKENLDSRDARSNMINRQKNAYKSGSK